MFVRIAAVALVVLLAWAVLARDSEGAGPERGYVVRPGDTLWTIAASHYPGDPREAVWEIEQRNGLAGALIRPGQRLVLPRG
jgi:nucleoid-associated protein YgaU